LYAPTLAGPGHSGMVGEKRILFSFIHLKGLLLPWSACAGGAVGLLYGAILPMFPGSDRTAGFLAPLFWSGLLYGGLAAVNPT